MICNRMVFMATVVICLSTFATKAFGTECPIIPQPEESSIVNGEVFRLSSQCGILYDDCYEDQALLLQKELMRFCNMAVSVAPLRNGNTGKGRRTVFLKSDKTKNPENYRLEMDSQSVYISSSAAAGIINGIMSFLQLAMLEEERSGAIEIKCWKIKDAPQYAWRGFMLDEARHFFGKEKVKQILSWMSFYKLNRFHWHLTDSQGWRIEIKAYPNLAYIGGIGYYSSPYAPAQYYTQEDIKEIVSYAKERNIEVIPEIDMPGHASAAVRAYPEYSGGGSPDYPNYTFNPGKDTVYSFLTAILKEVDALFPSQIIHLGGDEVHYGNKDWNSDREIQALMDKEQLGSLPDVERYFFKRIADSLFRINNRIAAWDEVASSDLPPEKTIIYFWRQNRQEQLQKAFDKGYSVVLSPRLPMYLDYPQDTVQVYGVDWRRFPLNTYRKIYEFDPMGFDVKYPKDANILGVQANLWTERVVDGNRLDYMLFPRIAALSEAAWTKPDSRDLNLFEGRLKKHFGIYQKNKIYFLDVFNPQNTPEPRS